MDKRFVKQIAFVITFAWVISLMAGIFRNYSMHPSVSIAMGAVCAFLFGGAVVKRNGGGNGK